jgi:membrane-associated phospholipid phosphatase
MICDVAFRRWLLLLVLCVMAVVVCVCCIDRPAAVPFNTHLRNTAVSDLIKGLLGPLVLIPVAALLFLFGVGCWLLSGRLLGGWTQKPLLCSWSTIWALAAEFVFKDVFGRGWPDPTFIENHLYGFRFLHAGPYWTSFPSGTATIAAAISTTIWLVAPRLRLPILLMTALICGGVVVTNEHWISDVIAGAFLGASIGWMTLSLLGSRVRIEKQVSRTPSSSLDES